MYRGSLPDSFLHLSMLSKVLTVMHVLSLRRSDLRAVRSTGDAKCSIIVCRDARQLEDVTSSPIMFTVKPD